MPAMTARRVQPGYADPVAFLYRGYAPAHGGDGPNAFMTGNEGRVGLDRPVAICGMQVRMTHTARFDLHKDLAPSNLRDRYLLDRQRLLELAHHRCFHRLRHSVLPDPGVEFGFR
jgi:hypothetical protein